VAAIAWSDVTGAAVEIANATTANLIPTIAQTIILGQVNGAGLNVANFGGESASLTYNARVLLALHMATMWLRQGQGGPITAQSEGEASQSYGFPWTNPATLLLTSYGQLLRGIISGTPARAGMLV
jgi:hypothetical protein